MFCTDSPHYRGYDAARTSYWDPMHVATIMKVGGRFYSSDNVYRDANQVIVGFFKN